LFFEASVYFAGRVECSASAERLAVFGLGGSGGEAFPAYYAGAGVADGDAFGLFCCASRRVSTVCFGSEVRCFGSACGAAIAWCWAAWSGAGEGFAAVCAGSGMGHVLLSLGSVIPRGWQNDVLRDVYGRVCCLTAGSGVVCSAYGFWLVIRCAVGASFM